MDDLSAAVATIVERRQHVPVGEAMLVAVTGIDASGKGYVSSRLVAELQGRGFHAVAIGVDGWLNLPDLRFDPERPGEHFYRHAIRFDEMFASLVLPLKRNRSVRLEADFTEETATAYRKHVYDFQDVDILILEGVFLLKPEFRRYHDLALWVDCTHETALERAILRGQEGLPPDETVRAFRTIYFPAQEIHERLDTPRSAADLIVCNDPRLEGR